MKLSSAVAKFRGGKVKVLGLLGGLLLAGAAMSTAAPAANAQVSFGVAVGAPRYYAPRYIAPRPVYRTYVYGPVYGPRYGYAPGYWNGPRYEGWREHAVFAHRDWRYDRRPYGWR